MTHNASRAVPPPRALPAATVTGTSSRHQASGSTLSTGRLIGIDLARGLAVFGMYSAHVGPDVTVGGPVGFLLELARGRSSALFALLAGFSLVLITGRPEPRTGRAGRQAVTQVVIRSLVLIALGFALTALDTAVDVILAYYGLMFLAVLPLYRLRARTLTVIAAAGALVLPQVLHLVRESIGRGRWADTVIAWDPLARISDSDGLLELLFTGEYPALTWIPFMVAGMAVARLDLTRVKARARLAGAGARSPSSGTAAHGWPCTSSRMRSPPSPPPRTGAPPPRPGGPTRSVNRKAASRPSGCWWPHRTARRRSRFSATPASLSPSWPRV